MADRHAGPVVAALAVLLASTAGGAGAAEVAPVGDADAAASAAAGIQVRSLPPVAGNGLRFLGVDDKGRVFVLHTADLEVVPVTTEEVGEPVALEESAGFTRGRTVVAAAMGAKHDEWLLRAGAFDVRWFRSGRQEPLPKPTWMVEDVVFANNEPILAVQPLRRSGGTREGFGRPLLLGRSGHRWTPLAEVEAEPTDPRLVSENAGERREAMVELRWRHTVELAGEEDGHVWVADEYAYRLREFSPGGRQLTDLVLADVDFEIVERAEAEREEIAAALESQGREAPPGFDRRPRAAILGMAVAQGAVYLVVHDEGQVVLDRWDPVNLYLERTPLDGELPAKKLSMAAGADGLFLVTVGGAAEEAWWLDWSSIETAAWRPVEGATVNGQPVVGRRAAEVRIVRTAAGVTAAGRRGVEEWSYEVRGETPERSFLDRMVERRLLDADQRAAVEQLGRERVTMEQREALAGELVSNLNDLLFAGKARLAAVDARQLVDLVVEDAEVAEVVAGLVAVDVVRIEP